MKRIIVLLLAACIIFTACGTKTQEQESEIVSDDTVVEETNDENIESLNEMQFDLSDYGCYMSYSIQHHIDTDKDYLTVVCFTENTERASDTTSFLYALMNKIPYENYTFMVHCDDLYIWYFNTDGTEMVSSANSDGTTVLGAPDWFAPQDDEDYISALIDTYNQYQKSLKGDANG